MPNTAFVREMSANDFHNCKWLAVCFFPVSVARRLRHGRCSICSVEYNSPRLRDATADERVHRFCFLLFFTAKVSGFCTGGHLMRICGLTFDIAKAKQRSFANTALCSLRRAQLYVSAATIVRTCYAAAFAACRSPHQWHYKTPSLKTAWRLSRLNKRRRHKGLLSGGSAYVCPFAPAA